MFLLRETIRSSADLRNHYSEIYSTNGTQRIQVKRYAMFSRTREWQAYRLLPIRLSGI